MRNEQKAMELKGCLFD